jgi:Fe-S oxidoreductase
MPKEYETLLWNILEEANPSGEAKSGRAAWMKGLDLKQASDAKFMLYVGDAESYDPRLQKVARSMANIMNVAGTDFGVLGKNEPNSGEAVYEIGDEGYLEFIVENNVKQFNETGVNVIVPLSPHAYNVMKHIYPKYGLDAEVVHYTEYLYTMLNENKLAFKGLDNTMDVTYHDPCFLGRYNGVFEEPRALIEAIPNVNMIEMDENKWNAICCGGGGNNIYKESEDGVRLSDVRVNQASETGATNMLTSCGYCVQNFEDSSKTTGKNMVVNDLLELVDLSLRRK